MTSLRERIENNLPIFFLATLATGFAAGFATYRAIQEATNVVAVRRTEFEQLKKAAELRSNPPAESETNKPSTSTTTVPSSATMPATNEQPLDGTIPVLSSAHCWDYVAKPTSIGGRLFESYAIVSYGCDQEALTFDIRGWKSFEGFVGVTDNDARPNTLNVRVDEQQAGALQVFYNQSPKPLRVDLAGHSTLTFQKAGRYPLIVIGAPRLIKN